MNQRERSSVNNQKTEKTDNRLRAKLKRNYQRIKDLKQKNQALKQEVENLKKYINGYTDQDNLLDKDRRNLQNPDFFGRKNKDYNRFFVPQYYVFIITTISIISVFISLGLILTKTFSKQQGEQTQKTVLLEETEKTTNQPTPSPALPSLEKPLNSEKNKIAYTHLNYPEFTKNEKLELIVNDIKTYVKKAKMPTEKLSITLIDLNTQSIAGYQQEKLVYPASVVKLFWLVALYGKLSNGTFNTYDPYALRDDADKMIKRSDNEASSRIVDVITNTKSGDNLEEKQYKEWLKKRKSLNLFFQNSGYDGIDISQKTFPIPSEKMLKPQGRDLQMRGDLNKPIRNKISTFQASKLMYEIFTNKAISPHISQELQNWLLWDLNSLEWRNLDPNIGQFNPIRTFFGELLPTNINFASKAGWTTNTRQEVAYISTKDGRIAYILAIFGEDQSYSKDGKLFPQISLQVFKKMSKN